MRFLGGGGGGTAAACVENDDGGFVVVSGISDAVVPFESALYDSGGLIVPGTRDIRAPRTGVYQLCYEIAFDFADVATGTITISGVAVSPQTGSGHGRALLTKQVTNVEGDLESSLSGTTVPILPFIFAANPGLVWRLLLSNLTNQDLTVNYAFWQVAYLG